MRQHHHFEYKRHHVREKLMFLLISASFILLDVLNFVVYAADILDLTCQHFQSIVHPSKTDYAKDTLCHQNL